MTPETVSLIAAILFLLIAVVGGGFTAKEIAVPQVPNWARAVSAVLGITFAIPFLLNLDNSQEGSQTPPTTTSSSKDEVTIYSSNQTDISPEHLKLSGLQATSRHDPPQEGDRITVSFDLDNVARRPFHLAFTFIAARDPTDKHYDFGISHNSTSLLPGQSIAVTGSIIPDSAGTWTFWPCYAFTYSGKEMYCPNEWHVFPQSVKASGAP